jgi:exodeoxyribonuclease V alpha subunit
MNPAFFSDNTALLALLERWAEHGWLRALDVAFASFLAREAPDAPPLLILAAALASHQLGRGHACLDLAHTLADPGFALSLPPEGADSAAEPLPLPAAVLDGVSLAGWQQALQHPPLVSDGAGDTPLVRVGTRLYLRRYWQYEQSVRAGIDARLAAPPACPSRAARRARGALPPARGRPARLAEAGLRAGRAERLRHRHRRPRHRQDHHRGAPAGGAAGPGHRRLRRPPLRIRLAAPTGKAAARLNESIAGAVAKLDLAGLPDGEAVRAAIPVEVTTLHRLLGSRPDTRHFRHHAGNPLPVDVLVVDEASMVDLEMMAAVLAALPPGARLVLLGDKDQLASVEAGAVLGELCRRAQQGHYSADSVAWLAGVTGEQVARSSSTRPAGPSTRRWRCCATATASAATAASGSSPPRSMPAASMACAGPWPTATPTSPGWRWPTWARARYGAW